MNEIIERLEAEIVLRSKEIERLRHEFKTIHFAYKPYRQAGDTEKETEYKRLRKENIKKISKLERLNKYDKKSIEEETLKESNFIMEKKVKNKYVACGTVKGDIYSYISNTCETYTYWRDYIVFHMFNGEKIRFKKILN